MQFLFSNRVSAISEFICDTHPVHKGQSGFTMATNFGTKIVMAALWNRAGHYIFVLWFLSSSSFFFVLFSSRVDC